MHQLHIVRLRVCRDLFQIEDHTGVVAIRHEAIDVRGKLRRAPGRIQHRFGRSRIPARVDFIVVVDRRVGP